MDDIISVIIPVYNVEKYIRRCLDSVVNQTYKNLDIIVVNDGSQDMCPQICDEYAMLDSRIRVIHQENQGQGHARNVGLDLAEGTYVAFLDSDDYWDVEYVNRLYAKAIDTGADIVICNYIHVDEDDNPTTGSPKSKIIEKVYSGKEAMRVALYWKEFGVAPWAKLYRKEVWKGVCFVEGRIYEDLATTYLIYFNSSKVCFINQPLMFYRIRSNSDIHQKFNTRKAQILVSADEIFDFCKKNAPECLNAARSRQLASACFIYFRIPNEELKMYNEIVDKCKTMIKTNRMCTIFDSKARIKTRAGAFLSLFGFAFERKIFSKMVK